MVEHHGGAQHIASGIAAGLLALSRTIFPHQAGFIEKLVALQHLFLVPGDPVGAETEPHPVAAQFAASGCWRRISRRI